ncbi:ABC transporter permease [Krasilnikovia sp. MM14-A1259]|uniref:ABC transporter permease n=1 Tax=Krasilnikovia sp. MM14-A1259 TaxID=3373539 RepID=UPI0038242B05
MIALATIRHRWAAFVGTFATLTLGVALISSTLLVYLSAAPHVPGRYAGTGVFVQNTGVPWSPEAVRTLTARLRDVPGVTGVVPARSFYAQLVRDGRPVGLADPEDPQGHSWSTAGLAPYPLRSGLAPARDGEVVVGRALGLPPGSPVTLLTAAGPQAYTVTGTIDGPGLYVSDAAADRLAGGVRLLGVQADPDADPAAIRAAAGAARVVTGDDRDAALEEASETRTRMIGAQLLTGMVTLGAFVSVFVVAATFALAAGQRRREFGLLRAIGATPRQVRRTVYGEAVGIGVVGAAVGVLLGALTAPVLGDILVDGGFEPPGFATQVRLGPLVLAYVAGIVVAVLGAVSAAWRASRIAPIEALREASVDERPMPRVRRLGGALAATIGAAVAVCTSAAQAEDMITMSMLAAMSLITGLTLLSPAIMPGLVRVVTWPLRRFGGITATLVHAGSVTAVRRTAATAAPVIVTVGLATLILGQVATMSAHEPGTAAVRSSAVVQPAGTPGLSDAVLRALPAGSSVAVTPTELYAGGDLYGGAGVDPATLTTGGQAAAVRAGTLSDFGAPDTLIVADQAWIPFALGDRVPITFADGRSMTMRVVATVDWAAATGPLLLPRATVRAHDPSALTPAVYVDGVPLATLRAAVDGLGATAVPAREHRSVRSVRETALTTVFTTLLIGLCVGYTGIAIITTLVLATAGRARDFTVLRLSGATVGQVLRTVAAEATLTVGLGATLGLLVAFTALAGVRSGVSQAVGAPVELSLSHAGVATVIAACWTSALAASLIPAWLAARRRGRFATGEH